MKCPLIENGGPHNVCNMIPILKQVYLDATTYTIGRFFKIGYSHYIFYLRPPDPSKPTERTSSNILLRSFELCLNYPIGARDAILPKRNLKVGDYTGLNSHPAMRNPGGDLEFHSKHLGRN